MSKTTTEEHRMTGQMQTTAAWQNRPEDANIWDNVETSDAVTALGGIFRAHRCRWYAENPGDGGQSWEMLPQEFHSLRDAIAALDA